MENECVMENNILLIHKALTGQASNKELVEFKLLQKENEEFRLMAEEISLVMDVTDGIELPFEVDVDAAFMDFTNKIELEKSDSKIIDISKSKIERNISTENTKSFRIKNFMKIAAVGAVLLMSVFLFENSNLNKTSSAFSFNNVEGIENHVLADNSSITLNSGAELVGMEGFNSSKRVVKLIKGEAFFKIAKNKQKPFIVEMEEVEVLVTGTAFDITNTEEEIIISVEEGSVQVKDQNNTYNLKVLDHLVYNKKTKIFTKSQVQSSNVFNWVNNELFFESTPLNIVFDDISRFYQVDISYPASATNCNYTSPLFKNLSLDEVLKKIELSFELEIIKLKNNEIAISKLDCN